jgi:hypothetical protein
MTCAPGTWTGRSCVPAASPTLLPPGGSTSRPRQCPLAPSPAPTGTGVNGTLAVLNDIHGHQVTYHGHPLYTFADDHPGQVTGQGVQGFFVATPGVATTGPAQARSPAR